MLRRGISSSCAAATFASASALVAAQRSICVFTQQNQMLQNKAKYKGYTVTVWWEHADLWLLRKVGAELKPNEEAITVQIDRRVELYNLAQYAPTQRSAETGFAADLPPATQHSSFRSKQPYGATFQSELAARAGALGLPADSKYWLTAKEAARWHLRLSGTTPDMRAATSVVARLSSKVYSAQQFDKPDVVARIPVSGLSKRPFGPEMAKPLLAVVAERQWPTGLFFTEKQLDLFGLKARAGETAISVAMPPRGSSGTISGGPSTVTTVYTLADVEGAEDIMKSLGRAPLDEPAMLHSGKPLRSEWAALAKALLAGRPASPAANHFLTGSEIQRRGYKLKEGAVGFEVGAAPTPGSNLNSNNAGSLSFFHAEQLEDPAKAYTVAGTKA